MRPYRTKTSSTDISSLLTHSRQALRHSLCVVASVSNSAITICFKCVTLYTFFSTGHVLPPTLFPPPPGSDRRFEDSGSVDSGSDAMLKCSGDTTLLGACGKPGIGCHDSVPCGCGYTAHGCGMPASVGVACVMLCNPLAISSLQSGICIWAKPPLDEVAGVGVTGTGGGDRLTNSAILKSASSRILLISASV